MKINNRKLQNMAINHPAYIDCKDLVKNYRECTRKSYFFLTIDTTLSASDLLEFKRIFFFHLVKMIVTDQIKILCKMKHNLI